MRILKVTQGYPPFLDRGGLAVKVPALAEHLAKRGHDVTVLTADLGLDGRKARNGSSKAKVLYLRTTARYRALTLNPGVLSFCQRQLPDFDVVHIYGLYDLLGPVVASGCRWRNIPYVVEPMGMTRPIVRSLRSKRLYLRFLGSKMMRAANLLVATSDQEARELLEYGARKEQVIVRRNGIDAADRLPERGSFRRQWNIPPEAKVALFLGRLVEKKNPDLLIDAFSRAVRNGNGSRNWFLVLAGPHEDERYRRNLESAATQSGAGERVRFAGALFGNSKWAAYCDADVFVLPSQNENFGNTVGEALLCGTPVIVTNQCGIAPMVDGRAGLVIPSERDVLQAALERLLDEDSLRERLKDGCRLVTSSLSWDEPVTQMESLYEQLSARNS